MSMIGKGQCPQKRVSGQHGNTSGYATINSKQLLCLDG